MKYFVYIIQAIDGSFYTGYSTDINRRLFEHNNSRLGAKSLKGKLPVKLVYFEEFKSKTSALKREYEIKTWPRYKKMELVKHE